MASTGYEPLFTLKQVAEGLWIVDGSTISFYGMPFPTRMTLVRLEDGSLFVHSPVDLREELRREVDALGPVRALVAPNWIHYAYLPAWQKSYPKAKTWAAEGVQERAAKQGVNVALDHILDDVAPSLWRGQIKQLVVRGSTTHREVVFFHCASRTLILTDLIENFEAKKVPFKLRLLARLAGISDPDGKMPLDMRMTFRFGEGGKGLGMLRDAVEVMLSWEPERVIVAHGRWYSSEGSAELRRAFRWLL
ncbi:DUF4336 domain-containing protein [Lujinxingia vulgaris]|uniref:DUF4336 domain-containing protein n=1 Tax=Lujinxingia vulgaris TaxID=2600176 RepID=A0A5C6XQK9_9DELT|nr:DUF4336 domain-containing protein [Lujinxingia vulgaris]TXD40843.1 DUF4336 domain-containing protein [Lujinxingia vulgaris]